MQNMPFSEALLHEAGQWLARIDGNDTDQHSQAFETWCKASPDHAHAFEWVRARDAAGRSVPPSVKVQTWINGLHVRPGKDAGRVARRTWLWAGSAIAAGLLLTLGIRSLPSDLSPGHDSQIAGSDLSFTARRGEIREVHLADGSTVTLDTGSRVEVAMSGTERTVRLAQGHARFKVVSDPRPFRVEAGTGVVTAAAQAVFDVGIDDDHHVLVQLVSGQADVRPMLHAAVLIIPAQSMASGQSFAYRADDYQPSPMPLEASSVDRSQWPTGWVDVHSISLDALIAEANRYAAQPIVVDDPATGALTATGRFKVSDTEGFVTKIADVFQLGVDRRTDDIHLRPK